VNHVEKWASRGAIGSLRDGAMWWQREVEWRLMVAVRREVAVGYWEAPGGQQGGAAPACASSAGGGGLHGTPWSSTASESRAPPTSLCTQTWEGL
jgi:hypothetical protein